MKLTAENVNKIVEACTDQDGEQVSGVRIMEFFSLQKIEHHRKTIVELLDQLPPHSHGPAGGSFLDACIDHNDIQWGEHYHVDRLLVLGIASGDIQFIYDRSQWSSLRGGMPMFRVIQ